MPTERIIKMVKKDKTSLSFVFCTTVIFIFIFICNLLTDKCADDYGYFINFATKERITSFFEIFESMAAHAVKMNGRLVAHFLVQMFLLLPAGIFKVVNTIVFMMQIFIIYRISAEDNRKPMLLLWIFGALWLYEPAFGQVNFWLDGSCNYLWSITAGLIFLYPFINKYIYDKNITNKFVKLIFVIFSFFAGAFLENASASVIFISVLLLIAIKFINYL